MRRRRTAQALDVRDVWSLHASVCYDPDWIRVRDALGARAQAERECWERFAAGEDDPDDHAWWMAAEAQAFLSWQGHERWLREQRPAS